MRIAIAQISSSTVPEENLALMRSVLPQAAGADLVLFPEATMASFAARSSAVAEALDGPFAAGVRALAAEFATTIAVGMFTPAGERCRNTLLVTGMAGEWSYDKLHLFDAFGFEESAHLEPGENLVLIEVAGVKLGLAICYDLRFPELFKEYARAGAAAVLLPASWQDGPHKVDQWRTLVRARALDSTCYLIGCGQAEPVASGRTARPGLPLGVGHSLAVAPDGQIRYEAGPAPEVFAVEVDTDLVAEVRQAIPVLANSRFVSGLVRSGESGRHC